MRKAQVALEFITTYGWAMLVILGAIGAISYFGVFRVNVFVPDRCEISNEFACVDAILYADSDVARSEIEMVLQNTAGKIIVVYPMTVTYEDQVGSTACGRLALEEDYRPNWNPPIAPITVPVGGKFYVICNAGTGESLHFPANEKIRVLFDFNWQIGADGFNHTGSGEVISRVQP